MSRTSASARIRFFRRARLVLPVLAATGTAVLFPTGAEARPEPGAPAVPVSSNDAELARRQAPMLLLADELEKAGKGSTASGYAGVTLDVPAGVVDLYWKGTPPAGVAAAAKRSPGVRLRVHAAAHSAAELRAHSDRIIRARGLSAGGTVHRVTPLPDGSGLELGVVAGTGSKAAAGTPDPLVVRTETEARPTPYASRWGGDSPFEAGIQIDSCSAAFTGYTSPAGPNGNYPRKIVTAAHCFAVGDEVHTSSSSKGLVAVGHVEAVNPDLDTALISVDSGDITNKMWDGGVDDGTEYTKPVVGTSAPKNGALVCTSGASSGVHCGIKIVKTNSTLDWGDHVSRAVSTGDQVQGLLASGNGDSGGPVFTLDAGSQVLAAGVIIGGDPARAAACTYRSNRCSSRLFFTDFRTVKSFWGLYT